MAVLRILGKASSINVRKVLWTCEEIGIDYEQEDFGSGFASTLTPDFLTLNPNGLVPVIETEDGVLWESNTICRYLAAKYRRPDLLPADPWPRALVERWMDWQATELNGAWRSAFMGLVRKDPAFADPSLIADSVRAWSAKMAILEQHLGAGSSFLVGDRLTLADIVIGLSINRWYQTPIDHPEFLAVAAYWQLLKSRPAFQRGRFDAVP